MALHINDLIAKGADEGDIEEKADNFLDDTLGEDSSTIVNTWLILGQLDPLEVGTDGKPRWTAEQQKLITEASTQVEEYTD